MSFDALPPWTAAPPPPGPPPRRNGPVIAAIVVAVAVVATLVIGATVFLRSDADEAGRPSAPTGLIATGSSPAAPSDSAALLSAATVTPAIVAPATVEAATVTVTAAPPVTVTAPPPVTITAPAPATVVVPAPAPVYQAAYGDLGLSVPMTRPACDGLGIALLFSSVSPGAYAGEIQQALDSYPGASYLRTDQACPSLTQRSDSGNPIYAVYVPAGYSTASVCSAVNSYGGSAYGKWLDNSTAASATIDC